MTINTTSGTASNFGFLTKIIKHTSTWYIRYLNLMFYAMEN